jgi:tetratricopeptide (TPR) repeat protein
LDPKNSDVFIGRGNIQYFQKNYEEALRFYDQAISLNSDAANAYAGIGYSKFYLKQYQEASNAFDKYLALISDDAEVLYFKSMTLADLNDIDNCIIYLKKATDLDSSYKDSALKEEAFKAIYNNARFIEVVYDITNQLDSIYVNADVFEEPVFSNMNFVGVSTTANPQLDSTIIQAASKYPKDLLTGNLYNDETADACNIYKNSKYRDEIIKIGRSIKSNILLGQQISLTISEAKIIAIGKVSGEVNAAIVSVNEDAVSNGTKVNVKDIYLVIKDGDSWKMYGALAEK